MNAVSEKVAEVTPIPNFSYLIHRDTPQQTVSLVEVASGKELIFSFQAMRKALVNARQALLACPDSGVVVLTIIDARKSSKTVEISLPRVKDLLWFLYQNPNQTLQKFDDDRERARKSRGPKLEPAGQVEQAGSPDFFASSITDWAIDTKFPSETTLTTKKGTITTQRWNMETGNGTFEPLGTDTELINSAKSTEIVELTDAIHNPYARMDESTTADRARILSTPFVEVLNHPKDRNQVVFVIHHYQENRGLDKKRSHIPIPLHLAFSMSRETAQNFLHQIAQKPELLEQTIQAFCPNIDGDSQNNKDGLYRLKHDGFVFVTQNLFQQLKGDNTNYLDIHTGNVASTKYFPRFVAAVFSPSNYHKYSRPAGKGVRAVNQQA